MGLNEVGTGVARDWIASGLTRAEFLLFQELIGETIGLRLAEDGWTWLRAALCDRLAAVGLSSFGEYYELLRSPDGAQELNQLVELVTVHETAFFRNRPHFEALAAKIVPELVSKKETARTLRFWSAGCSTGQEAYSIAITLLESVPCPDSWHIEVLATDISHRALETARAGSYPERALRDVDPLLVDRYFDRCDDGYRVRDRVRRLVRFEYLNLVKEPFPLAALSPCDVIFCQNVTIYFKIESTRRVVRNFYETLRDGGYLFLGYSETLWHISNDFALVDLGGAYVYQKRPDRPPEGEVHTPTVERPQVVQGSSARTPRLGLLRSQRQRLRPLSPPRRAVTLEEATALCDARRFEEALLAVEGVLAASPGNPAAHLLAARLRADREEVGAALRHCRKALDADPLLDEAHYLAGVLSLRVGDRERAAESFSRVVYLSPTSERAALAHFHLAGIRTDEGDPAGAVREYRNALRVLERFPRDKLVGEFSTDFLARVCRRRLEELQTRM